MTIEEENAALREENARLKAALDTVDADRQREQDRAVGIAAKVLVCDQVIAHLRAQVAALVKQCGQCGHRICHRACGPTHAVLFAEALAALDAVEKEQQR